jgi:hypothetical protein
LGFLGGHGFYFRGDNWRAAVGAAGSEREIDAALVSFVEWHVSGIVVDASSWRLTAEVIQATGQNPSAAIT